MSTPIHCSWTSVHYDNMVVLFKLCKYTIEWAPCMGLLSYVHPVTSKCMCINHMDCKSQNTKEKVVRFCETLPVFLMSSISALAGELVRNICVFC